MKFPLSLYIHMPWCIKKCPYCDFNSHALQSALPESAYIDRLIDDLQTQLPIVQNRSIHSIFIGGGTPSLLSPDAYAELFSRLKSSLVFEKEIEITLEANPGTTDSEKFQAFFETGINRISIGVQSFQDNQLKTLGRIHASTQAKNAIIQAQQAGFKRINIDLMFGLPNQTIAEALLDLQTAIDLSPTHISWYQLTLEPNTYFYRFPPVLPTDDDRYEMQQAGQALLRKNDFLQYEISAYGKMLSTIHPIEKNMISDNTQQERIDVCRHNINYWQFGDYLGIGAGAHAKFTDLNTMAVTRRWNTKHPKQYLSTDVNNLFNTKIISSAELPLEFMMNALRLFQPVSLKLFYERTGLSYSTIENHVKKAITHDLLTMKNNEIRVTNKGHLFLNELLEILM